MRRNKGQVQIMELLAVAVIIVLILVMLIVGYFRATIAGLEKAGEESGEQEQSVLLAGFSSLPEISCGDGCIDTSRLLGFKGLLKDGKHSGYYGRLTGRMGIEVKLVYPLGEWGECDLQAYQSNGYPESCDSWMLFKKEEGKKVSSPISLYYPESGEYRIGRLIITL